MSTFINVPADSDFPIQNLPYGIFSTPNNVSLKKVLITSTTSNELQETFLTLNIFIFIFSDNTKDTSHRAEEAH